MCWQYEDKYGCCLDHLCACWASPTHSDTVNENLVSLLEKEFNIKVVDCIEFEDVMRGLIYPALSLLHEKKAIVPKEKVEVE